MSRKEIISRIAGLLVHPILMALYISATVIFRDINHTIPLEYKLYVLSIIAGATIVAPLALVPILDVVGIIESYRMKRSRDRIVPIILSAIGCVFCGIHLGGVHFFPLAELIFYCLAASLILIAIMQLLEDVPPAIQGLSSAVTIIAIFCIRLDPAMLVPLQVCVFCWGAYCSMELYAGRTNGSMVLSSTLLGVFGTFTASGLV